MASIVETAWKLARTHGVGEVTLHGLAREVGMRQPSLYAYFDSKNALFDAMFADGNRRLLGHLDALQLPADPNAAVKAFMQAFVTYALEDSARSQLLLQRPVPGFEPSAESYAYAQQVLGRAVDVLRTAGVDEPGDVDCFVAMIAGLIDAQMTNDPGGTRWIRHLDRLIDLYLDDATRRRTHP
ncbi:MAG: TetR/AcrR family transcriptional regulator [Ilumatobacteraceae bacterium]